jgi:mannose-1-phosphate guanylyltransferase
MLYALIMAGGTGTRFWPESRQKRPKQLLNLTGARSMIQLTLDRLAGLIPTQRTLVITNEALVREISGQLPELPTPSLIGEPCKRDTAPCIGLAALLIARQDADATMAVLPADHVIRPVEKFQAAIEFAADLIDKETASIVTFGIPPTYPAESFGYIQRGDPLTASESELSAFRVKRFREKPKADKAREYLASGDNYWNSGIFVWKARTIIDSLARLQPQMFERLKRIDAAWDTPDRDAVFRQEYAAIQGISIDYAVMENARDVAVIEAPFEWDDVGNWQSLVRLRGADADNNTVAAKHLGVNTHGCIIRGADDHLIVTLGLKDCLIVHTPDATLVANKHDEEALRQVVKLLEERGWKEYL